MVRAQGLQLVLFRKQRSTFRQYFPYLEMPNLLSFCSRDSLTVSCPWTAVQWPFAKTARQHRTSNINSCWVTRNARQSTCVPTRCKIWWSGSRPWTLQPQHSPLAVVHAAQLLVAPPLSQPALQRTACLALRPRLPRWRVRWSWRTTTTTWMWIITRLAMRDNTRLAHQSKDSNNSCNWRAS